MSLSFAAAAVPWALFSANVNGLTTASQHMRTCVPDSVMRAARSGKTFPWTDVYTPAFAQCLCPAFPGFLTLFQDVQCSKLMQDQNAQAGVPISDAEMAAKTQTMQAGVTACAGGRYDEVARVILGSQINFTGRALRSAPDPVPSSTTATPPTTATAATAGATPSSTPSGTGSRNNTSAADGTKESRASTLSTSTVVAAAAAAAGIVFFVV
ncbi:hypothetical protein DFS34DRAFT_593404 [Phlyctochytrium arcticum]|nr:hypothetical protein DFS34DRAFT_593404 [Phlyctochytrium arcticum]